MDRALDDIVGDPKAYEAEEWTRPDEMAMFTSLWRRARRNLDVCEEATVLDLCCGTGMSLLGVISHLAVKEFIGVDIEPRCITFAEQRYSPFREKAFYCRDAATFSLESNGHQLADVILLSSAYHHMPDERKIEFLLNVQRNLSPSGVAVVAENILPKYSPGDDDSYMAAVRTFYSAVTRDVLVQYPRISRQLLSYVESNVELAAEKRVEFKTSISEFFSYVARTQLKVSFQERVWDPQDTDDAAWGNFIFELQSRG